MKVMEPNGYIGSRKASTTVWKPFGDHLRWSHFTCKCLDFECLNHLFVQFNYFSLQQPKLPYLLNMCVFVYIKDPSHLKKKRELSSTLIQQRISAMLPWKCNENELVGPLLWS